MRSVCRGATAILLIDEHQAELSTVTFCSWHPVITTEYVDRFVDRAIRANSAIRVTGVTT